MTNVSNQQEDKLALFEAGCRVMMSAERSRLEPTLARHLSQGISRHYKLIPKDGILSVTLSLSGVFWLARAIIAFIAGLVIMLLGRAQGSIPIKSVGLLIVIVGTLLYVIAIVRFTLAIGSRYKFRRHLRS